MTRVLVAHASKYGSVEEVARFVGAVLRDEGATLLRATKSSAILASGRAITKKIGQCLRNARRPS